MRLEIPECRRCCCCMPLRHGVLVFGYLNLMFSIFIVLLETVFTFRDFLQSSHTMTIYRGVSFYTQIWFAMVLYAAEIIFNVVLLVGAHMKKTHLLRVYYYYGITTTLASVVTYIVLWQNSMCVHCHWAYYAVEAGFVTCGVGIQVYLLLLIRSELLKIRLNSRLCYVNHATEMVVDTPIQTGRNPF